MNLLFERGCYDQLGDAKLAAYSSQGNLAE